MGTVTILIIVIIVVCYIFSKPADSTSSTTGNSTSRSPSTSTGNTFQYLTNHPDEQSFSAAKIINNSVYCCPSHTRVFKIGSYERNTDGTYDVWNDIHTIKIGYVDSTRHRVYLTPGNAWEDYSNRNVYIRSIPKDFVVLAADLGNGVLLDHETANVIAKYTGDPVAAGAAFVCLTWDLLTHNKYHDILRGWI